MTARPTVPTDSRGFTYVEVLVSGSLLAFTLFAVCGMFVSGYSNLTTSGKTTMGVSAGRQLMEDIRRIPYDNLVDLDGFDTDDASTLPASGPALAVARRWRYAMAGEGIGWDFSTTEAANWTDLSVQGHDLDAQGRVGVVQTSATLTTITVEVNVPGRFRSVVLRTVVAKLN